MKKVCLLFPKMKVITAKVDQGLNDVRSLLHHPRTFSRRPHADRAPLSRRYPPEQKMYIVPGLGDFGDR